jgi:hypothetical protein
MKRRRHQDGEDALIFDWNAHDGSTGRLLLAGLVTMGAFIALFLAFRILTPEPRPVLTRPQQVLVLNPEVPAERALINQAIDRSFALIPTDGVTGTLPSAVQMPVYKPGIASFELKPEPLNASATDRERPRFLSLDLDVEPQAAAPKPRSFPEAPRSVLRAVLDGDAAGRLAQGRELPGVALVDPNKPRFRVAVGARGQVLMAMPLVASEDAAVMEQLRVALMKWRFTPDQKPVEWTQVTFRWEEAP